MGAPPNAQCCSVDGCPKYAGPPDGSPDQDAIYRINPKGKGNGFVGMCTEHYREWTDPESWRSSGPALTDTAARPPTEMEQPE